MNITIVGMGLIGGSFAKALAGFDEYVIFGVDTNEKTLKKAMDEKVIAKGTKEAEEVLPKSDIVFICIYPEDIPQFVDKYRAYFKEGVILADAASTKARLVKEVLEVLPEQVDFVFTHPMRGSEKSGYEVSHPLLYQGANILFTPLERNLPENIEAIKKLYKKMGAGKISMHSPENHDKYVAYVSHLPHAATAAFINSASIEGDRLKEVAGSSFEDFTRVGKINADLWSDIFLGNRPSLLEAIGLFEVELAKFKKAVEEADKDKLKEYFTQSSERKQSWSDDSA